MGQGLGGARAYEVQVLSFGFQFPLMPVRNTGLQYGPRIIAHTAGTSSSAKLQHMSFGKGALNTSMS